MIVHRTTITLFIQRDQKMSIYIREPRPRVCGRDVVIKSYNICSVFPKDLWRSRRTRKRKKSQDKNYAKIKTKSQNQSSHNKIFHSRCNNFNQPFHNNRMANIYICKIGEEMTRFVLPRHRTPSWKNGLMHQPHCT